MLLLIVLYTFFIHGHFLRAYIWYSFLASFIFFFRPNFYLYVGWCICHMHTIPEVGNRGLWFPCSRWALWAAWCGCQEPNQRLWSQPLCSGETSPILYFPSLITVLLDDISIATLGSSQIERTAERFAEHPVLPVLCSTLVSSTSLRT